MKRLELVSFWNGEVLWCCKWWMAKQSGFIGHHGGCSLRVYLTYRWVMPHEEIGGCLCWIWLYEAHMEGMRPSNYMLIGWYGVLQFWSFLLFPLYMFSFSPCKLHRIPVERPSFQQEFNALAYKICVAYYPMYIALTNWTSFSWKKKRSCLRVTGLYCWLLHFWNGTPWALLEAHGRPRDAEYKLDIHSHQL